MPLVFSTPLVSVLVTTVRTIGSALPSSIPAAPVLNHHVNSPRKGAFTVHSIPINSEQSNAVITGKISERISDFFFIQLKVKSVKLTALVFKVKG